jgi:hypothetical protein
MSVRGRTRSRGEFPWQAAATPAKTPPPFMRNALVARDGMIEGDSRGCVGPILLDPPCARVQGDCWMPPFGWTLGLSAPGCSAPPGFTFGWTFGVYGTGALLSASSIQSCCLIVQTSPQSIVQVSRLAPESDPHSLPHLAEQAIKASAHFWPSSFVISASAAPTKSIARSRNGKASDNKWGTPETFGPSVTTPAPFVTRCPFNLFDPLIFMRLVRWSTLALETRRRSSRCNAVT